MNIKFNFNIIKTEPWNYPEPHIDRMKNNTESDWIQRAKEGESAALAELFNHYWRAVRAAAYGITGDIIQAEDVASDAFYAAMNNLKNLRDPERFGPWLHTIVVRTAKRYKNEKQKNTQIEWQIASNAQPSTLTDPLEQQELSTMIHEAVAGLSVPLREAVSLFYFEGYDLKTAAHFLDIPVGTFKRRLHDGRQRLRDLAEQIVKGTKPINPRREQILQQLKDTAAEGIDSEPFYQTMRQAFRLRPLPRQIFRYILQRHHAAKQKNTLLTPEKEQKLREMLGTIYRHSERAQDPDHPIGMVAKAIRAALPPFQEIEIEISRLDMSQWRQQWLENKEEAFSSFLTPNLARESRGLYLFTQKAWLVRDRDGSFCTTCELMQKKTTRESMVSQLQQSSFLSDAFQMVWKQTTPLELRTIESLLRRLAQKITPTNRIHLCPYDEPRYRTALRMQLDDILIPAAIGGTLNPLPGNIHRACLLIYLEPWASACTAKTFDLHKFPFLSLQ